jgi:hypothetical protein
VYYCASQAGGTARIGTNAACEKSTDGGLTWQPTGDPITTPALGPGNDGFPNCNGALGHGTTDSQGTLYLPHAQCGVPTLAISHDEGATWTNVRVSDTGIADYGSYIDHEAGVGVDGEGTIYYAWDGPDRLPVLAVSADGGLTWSEPLALAPAGLHQAIFPALAAFPDGRVAVAYYGSTNAPLPPFPDPTCNPIQCTGGEDDSDYADATWNGYLTLVEPGKDATRWTASVNPPDDPFFRGRCNAVDCGALGDFLDVRFGVDGSPWAAFVDACQQACVRGGDDNDASEGVVATLVLAT